MTDRPRCRWFHRWPSIDNSEWVGGIAAPVFRQVCRKCGAERVVRVTP